MKPAYLVDSDWVIHYLNGQPTVVAKLQELQEHGVAISIISLAELYEGVYYSQDPVAKEHDLDDFIRGLSVIGIDEDICKVFGRVRGGLRAKKKTVADFGCDPTATAISSTFHSLNGSVVLPDIPIAAFKRFRAWM